jgi:16S rRNA C967 or C1407 C5-methylase (RsmB/RsmF family)
VRLQRKLIASGVQAARPGGVLVYATCTLNLEENEKLVQWALDSFPLEVERIPVAIPGSFAAVARGRDAAVGRALRLFPDRDREGFFLCRLRKRG